MTITEKKETLILIVKELQKEFDAFGDIFYQLIIEQEKVYYGYIYIQFHTFEIQNELGAKHKIIDLMCRFKFRADFYENETFKFYLTDFSGKRLKMTQSEMMASYQHSHLTSNYKAFTPFCMGQGPLALWMYKMKKDPNYVWEINGPEYPAKSDSNSNSTLKAEFTHFRMLLNKYLVWESISGVPHKLINELKSFRPGQFSSTQLLDKIANLKLHEFYKFPKEAKLHYFERALPRSKEYKVLKSDLELFYLTYNVSSRSNILDWFLTTCSIDQMYPIHSILNTLLPLSEEERKATYRDIYSFPLAFGNVLDIFQVITTMSRGTPNSSTFIYHMIKAFIFLVEFDEENKPIGRYVLNSVSESRLLGHGMHVSEDDHLGKYQVGVSIPCDGITSENTSAYIVRTGQYKKLTSSSLSVTVIADNHEEQEEKVSTKDKEKENKKKFKFYLNPTFLSILLEEFKENLNILNINSPISKNLVEFLNFTLSKSFQKDVKPERAS